MSRHADPGPGEAAPIERHSRRVPLYRWMWPAWIAGRFRDGLSGAILADSVRLRQLPPPVGSVLLPAIALLLPAAVTAIQATTPFAFQPVPNPLALGIADVFTESIPFMAAGLAIGLVTPAAGVLFVLAYGVGNIAATVVTGELEPVPTALFARLVSYALLWLLAVEIPLLARFMTEWALRDEGAPSTRRWAAIAFGAAVTLAFTFVWSKATVVLITTVYFSTRAFGSPALAAVQPLHEQVHLFIAPAALAAIALLGLRYQGRWPMLSPRWRSRPGRAGPRRALAFIVPIGITLALLSGVIDEPIDAAVLLAALLVAGPLGRASLQAVGLAKPLSRFPAPLRVLAGFAVAAAVDAAFFSMFWGSDVSRFFHLVIAIAIGILVIAFFTSADDLVARSPGPGTPSVPPTIAAGVVAGTLVSLAFPFPVLADNCGDFTDCLYAVAQAAFVAAAVPVLAVIAAARWSWDNMDKWNPWLMGGAPPSGPPPPPPPPVWWDVWSWGSGAPSGPPEPPKPPVWWDVWSWGSGAPAEPAPPPPRDSWNPWLW